MKKDEKTIINDAYLMEEYLKDRYNSEGDAIPAGTLASVFNTDRRGIRNIVNFLRCSGKPICSSNNGYWYSSDPADIQKTIAIMSAKLTGIQKAITGLRTAKEKQDNTGEIA